MSLTHKAREPVGACYEHAAMFMMFDKACPVDAVLCHGYPTLTVMPYEKYGHAWIEHGDMVYDTARDPVILLPKVVYYAVGKIRLLEVVRYTKQQVPIMCLVEGATYGPWGKIPEDATFDD